MRCRERGLALVTVLLLLSMLLIIVLVLSDKVINATRDRLRSTARDQAVQAAASGIEWGRHQLAASYRDSSGWATFLAAAPGAGRYPPAPAFQTEFGGIPVELYLRDNPDGDDDPRRDCDLKVMLLSRARPAHGTEVVVESLCGLEANASAYSPHGQTETTGPAELWAAPVTTFHLQD